MAKKRKKKVVATVLIEVEEGDLLPDDEDSSYPWFFCELPVQTDGNGVSTVRRRCETLFAHLTKAGEEEVGVDADDIRVIMNRMERKHDMIMVAVPFDVDIDKLSDDIRRAVWAMQEDVEDLDSFDED